MNVYLRIVISVIVSVSVSVLTGIFHVPLIYCALLGLTQGTLLMMWVMAAPAGRSR